MKNGATKAFQQAKKFCMLVKSIVGSRLNSCAKTFDTINAFLCFKNEYSSFSVGKKFLPTDHLSLFRRKKKEDETGRLNSQKNFVSWLLSTARQIFSNGKKRLAIGFLKEKWNCCSFESIGKNFLPMVRSWAMRIGHLEKRFELTKKFCKLVKNIAGSRLNSCAKTFDTINAFLCSENECSSFSVVKKFLTTDPFSP